MHVRSAPVIVLLIAPLWSCSDQPTSLTPLDPAEHLTLSVPSSPAVISDDPAALASALRTIDNDLEVIVQLRHEAEAPPNSAAFEPYVGRSTVGVPVAASTRSTLRRSRPPGEKARTRVLETLRTHGLVPYLAAANLSFVAVRLPEQGLEGVLRALLHHPNVDFIEANERRRKTPEASGQVDFDAKHIDHFVEQAWTYTRGGGAKVGIYDSGFAQDLTTGSWHPDGLHFGTYGIAKLGFTDDVPCAGYPREDYQAIGQCDPRDDNADEDDPEYAGHGTKMAGFVGANDNSIGRRGVAPEANVYSLKVAFNTYPAGRGEIKSEILCNSASAGC